MVQSTSMILILGASTFVSLVVGDCRTGVCNEGDEVVLLQQKTVSAAQTTVEVKSHSYANTSAADPTDPPSKGDDSKPTGRPWDAIANAENIVVARAMKAIASTLINLVDSLKKEVDRLGEEGAAQTKTLKDEMDQANNTVQARAAVLETKLAATLDPVLEMWSAFAKSLETTSASITGALKTADKPVLAESINKSLTNIVAKVNGYSTELRAAQDNVVALRHANPQEAAGRIGALQLATTKCSDSLKDLPTEFGGVIAQLKEGIVGALPKDVPEDTKKSVMEAFDRVQTHSDGLSEDVVKTAKAFAAGLTDATLKVPVAKESGAVRSASCIGLLAAFAAVVNVV